jgi:threonine dehydrogenase-like Zn-dependent dehydrogenase
MRATVLRNNALVVDDIATPEPGNGEVLVKTLACGICGSDLHAVKHADQLADALRRSGAPFSLDPSRDIVMGHEFCGEIVDYGPNTTHRLKPGTTVCSMPFLIRGDGLRFIGYSDETPGGYGEYIRLTEGLLLEVPNGLPPAHAALAEPMAVGVHAVEKGRVDQNDVPLVIGCGPIGLAVIAALRLRDVHPIVAADFSPRRRQLAQALGADVVVDPSVDSPYEKWNDVAAWHGPDAPALPPWLPGPALRPSVIFECVGVTGVIDQIVASAPTNARIVVVGICMERDYIEPVIAINKELNLQFVICYTAEEYTVTLRNIADGKIAIAPLITGRIPPVGLSEAFSALASPEMHAKIVVEFGR